MDYSVYGLTLRVNRPLPYLSPGCASEASPSRVRVDIGSEKRASLSYSSEWVCLSYRPLEFAVSADGTSIWSNWSETSAAGTIGDVAGLLLGPVLGCTLRLRGAVSLHGSVVAVGVRAAVILAGHGGGKSTLAAAFAQAGDTVLSDDLAALTEDAGGWTVQTGYPAVRLAPEAIAAFGLAGPSLPRVFTGHEKRYVRLGAPGAPHNWRFTPRRRRVVAIYALARDADLRTPLISPLRGADRLTTLLAHRSASFASLGARLSASELATLSRLSTAVPVRRVDCPQGLRHLPALRDAIAADLTDGR